jgi:hypothetical protein
MSQSWTQEVGDDARNDWPTLSGTALAGSPADFGKVIADETEKWGKVIRAANIKAE